MNHPTLVPIQLHNPHSLLLVLATLVGNVDTWRLCLDRGRVSLWQYWNPAVILCRLAVAPQEVSTRENSRREAQVLQRSMPNYILPLLFQKWTRYSVILHHVMAWSMEEQRPSTPKVRQFNRMSRRRMMRLLNSSGRLKLLLCLLYIQASKSEAASYWKASMLV
jgi:hypothetical protein